MAGAVRGSIWFDTYGVAVSRGLRRVSGESVTIAPTTGSYLFVGLVWLGTTAGFGVVRYATAGRVPLARTPGLVAALPATLLVLGLLHRLRDRYRAVVAGLPPPEETLPAPDRPGTERLLGWLGAVDRSDPDGPGPMVPARLKLGLLGVAIGLHAAWFVLDPSPTSHLATAFGRPLALVYFLLVVPAVYSVLGADLVGVFLGIHLLLPLRVTSEGRVDFGDERRFGGLRPLGVLLRDGVAAAAIVVALFVVVEALGPGTSPLDPFSGPLVVAATLTGLVVFALPVYWLHGYMRERKAEKLAQIRRAVEAYGDDDRPFPDTEPVSPEDYDELGHQFVRLTLVENTREFPVDVTIAVEFLLVLALPYLAELTAPRAIALLGL